MTDTAVVDTADTTPAPRDGRSLRSERTKAAILAGCRTLMQTGIFRPPMALVCVQADVSVRSGFQHFEAIEDLYLAAIKDEPTRDSIMTKVLGADWRDALRWHDRAEKLIFAIITGRAET